MYDLRITEQQLTFLFEKKINIPPFFPYRLILVYNPYGIIPYLQTLIQQLCISFMFCLIYTAFNLHLHKSKEQKSGFDKFRPYWT